MEGRHVKGKMSSGFWRHFALTTNGCDGFVDWEVKGLAGFHSSNCAVVFWNDKWLKTWYLEIPANFPTPLHPSLSKSFWNEGKNQSLIKATHLSNFYSVFTKSQALSWNYLEVPDHSRELVGKSALKGRNNTWWRLDHTWMTCLSFHVSLEARQSLQKYPKLFKFHKKIARVNS